MGDFNNIIDAKHFKGIIQDVQISDGQNVTKIVEFFEFDENELAKIHPNSNNGEKSHPSKPRVQYYPIGEVSLEGVMKVG